MPSPPAMITVRLPKTDRDAFRRAAYRRQTSANRLARSLIEAFLAGEIEEPEDDEEGDSPWTVETLFAYHREHPDTYVAADEDGHFRLRDRKTREELASVADDRAPAIARARARNRVLVLPGGGAEDSRRGAKAQSGKAG